MSVNLKAETSCKVSVILFQYKPTANGLRTKILVNTFNTKFN